MLVKLTVPYQRKSEVTVATTFEVLGSVQGEDYLGVGIRWEAIDEEGEVVPAAYDDEEDPPPPPPPSANENDI
jgi:hypothetical protein